MSEEAQPSLRILPSALAETQGDQPFVAIVRSRQELCRWLSNPLPGLRWLQVEGMLGDPEAWREAAHSDSNIPLDVVLSDPASEFSHLYRLVDASAVRAIRVTMPAAPGLAKAIRLAAALRLPVRVLPGQPSAGALEELRERFAVLSSRANGRNACGVLSLCVGNHVRLGRRLAVDDT